MAPRRWRSHRSCQAAIAVETTRDPRRSGDHDIEHVEGVTSLFEIVYPANRIVVDYGRRRELILLAAICNETGLDRPLPSYSGPVVRGYGQRDMDSLIAAERPNREGFVVVFESGLRVKIKFAEYRRLHRIVTGVHSRMIWESMRDGDDLDGILIGLPDDVSRWITQMRSTIQEAFEKELAQARRAFQKRPQSTDRKTLAQYFLESKANTAVLFRMLDGKSCEDLIWKVIRPKPSAPQRSQAHIETEPEDRM